MPYARKNWTEIEVSRLLQNPVQIGNRPPAHSRIHGIEGDLASNSLFQRARVTNQVTTSEKKGKLITGTEVKLHSTLDRRIMSRALARALNSQKMQEHLRKLDEALLRKKPDFNYNLKFWINYIRPIGQANLYQSHGSGQFSVRCLFVYLRPNPGNRDLPIFQTVVPYENHKPIGSGNEPVVLVP